MNRSELIDAIAATSTEAAGKPVSKKDVEVFLSAFTTVIKDALSQGSEVGITGFGVFSVTERAAKDGRNPKTGETLTIAASKAPKFKPGKPLKDAVNGK